jgi:hypothetical protein
MSVVDGRNGLTIPFVDDFIIGRIYFGRYIKEFHTIKKGLCESNKIDRSLKILFKNYAKIEN